VSFASGPFDRGGVNGIYKVTQLLPREGEDYQRRVTVPLNRTSGSSKKASLVAFHDRTTGALGCSEGGINDVRVGLTGRTVRDKAQGRSAAAARLPSLCDSCGGHPFRCRRFCGNAALGAWMQVGDERFDSEDIHHLYERDDYPLQRRTS
jgi:hypothetical protein